MAGVRSDVCLAFAGMQAVDADLTVLEVGRLFADVKIRESMRLRACGLSDGGRGGVISIR